VAPSTSVLTVFSLHHNRADYYLADLAAELSFIRARGGPDGPRLAAGQAGRWLGRGAERLGLVGGVEAAPFRAVLGGRRPADNRALGSGRALSVSAFDLTFAAPKSVSVLVALAPTHVAAGVLAAHDTAVGSAFEYVETRALAVRRGTGGDRWVLPVTGATAAAFTHGLSRAGDPHLHTHLVLANLAQGDDGRWSALDSRGLFAHARAAGELYRAHLRSEMSDRLGVDWVRTAGGWSEVAGVPPLAIGAFSSRRADIEQEVAGRGVYSARARRVAWASTRDEKVGDPSAAPLLWRSRAAALGLAGPELGSVWGRSLRAADGLDERRFAATLGGSPDGAPRRAVIEAWAAALDRGGARRDIEGSVDRWVGEPDAAVGVGEPVRPIAPLLVPGHLIRALGPRPTTAADQDLWRSAARAVSQYRERWGVTDPVRALGVDGGARDLCALAAPRLSDHVAVSRHVADTRRALGRSLDRTAARDGLAWER
jgi:conjugative relaxase-like TrwC/TraI family protein